MPAKSSDFVEVYIDVPESEQSLHYNEKWETYVVITPPPESGGVNIQTEIAVKLFIQTPSGEAALFPSMYVFIVLLSLIALAFAARVYIRQKRRQAVFYFKKKNEGSSGNSEV